MHRVAEQWGTVITLDVRDLVATDSVDECFAWFERVDDLFSTWHPETEIMRIGRHELEPADASPEVQTVLAECDRLRDATEGAFDISVGGRPGLSPQPGRAPIDPSGMVKGWAVARAGDILRARGATNFFISAGGDVVVSGRPDDRSSGWRVGIQHPWQRDQVAAVVEVSEHAVATSGRYERGDHLLDPWTGAPVRGLMSVTVVGPDLATADAYATATMVLGSGRGIDWLAEQPGYAGFAITDDKQVITTTGFDKYRVS